MMNVDETKESFLALRKHVGEYDWDKIKAVAREEKERERGMDN